MALEHFPRDAFDYVWLIHPPAFDPALIRDLTPIRRWGRPDDVARAVVAIATDLMPFSTGEVINVDGGFHLRRL